MQSIKKFKIFLYYNLFFWESEEFQIEIMKMLERLNQFSRDQYIIM